MKKNPMALTRADSRALWRAVDWMALCLRESPLSPDNPALALEHEKLMAAKKALRKVQAIVRNKPTGATP